MYITDITHNIGVRVIVFNATFNNISVILWRSILLLEETGVPGENHRLIALPQLQSEIKVTLFLFASHSFLANNLRFMVKLIDKAIVINGKIHKNERKRFYSSNFKEG